MPCRQVNVSLYHPRSFIRWMGLLVTGALLLYDSVRLLSVHGGCGPCGVLRGTRSCVSLMCGHLLSERTAPHPYSHSVGLLHGEPLVVVYLHPS